MCFNEEDRYFMKLALEEAKKGFEEDEVPVGAILVKEGKIISSAYDKREKSNLITSHAEMLCIMRANKVLNSWRLENCVLYTTLEPCLMCSGAIIQARIKKVIYGANSPKFGAITNFNIFNQNWHTHKVEAKGGLLSDESKQLLQKFFKNRR